MSYIHPEELEGGCDECARGTLIYDVVAACVVLPKEFPDEKYKEIKDSKKLSAKKRDELAKYIKDIAITYGIGTVSAEEIDNINILQASIKAMHKSINEAYMKKPFKSLKIDGPHFKGYIPPGDDDEILPYECIPKGDSKYLTIAAASIVAKDYHDKALLKLIEDNPDLEKYGLRKNMGYATKVHRDALKQYGPSEWHRKTFSSVK